MTQTKKQIQEEKQDLARQELKKHYIKPTTRLIIQIKSVSKSGMSRQMAVYVFNKKEGRLQNITYSIAELLDYKYNDNNSITVSGCGMDMTFWLADYITQSLKFTKTQKAKLTGNGGNCLDWQTI